MTSPVPDGTTPPAEAVRAAALAICAHHCGRPHESREVTIIVHRREAEDVAAAVVAALRLPERDREAAAKALDEAVQDHEATFAPACSTSRMWLRARASGLREGRES